LRLGEWVLWNARPFRFVSLHGGAASIRASVNAELDEAAVAQLRGLPSLTPEDLDQRVDRLRTRIVQKKNRHSSGCDPMVVAEHSAEALSALNRVMG
jgi:hypothetical protein